MLGAKRITPPSPTFTAWHLDCGAIDDGMDAQLGSSDDRFSGPDHPYFARLSERPHFKGHRGATWHDTAQLSFRLSKLAAYGIIGQVRGTVGRARHKGSNLQSTLQRGSGRPDLSSAFDYERPSQPKILLWIVRYRTVVREYACGLSWSERSCHASGTQRISSCRSAHGGVTWRVCNTGRSPRRGTGSGPDQLGYFSGQCAN